MIDKGMDVENIGVQHVFIYLKAALTTMQINELTNLGITLFLDSWIPPVGSHPTGFLVADVPALKIHDLAAKSYVVNLNTAENMRQPQSSPQ